LVGLIDWICLIAMYELGIYSKNYACWPKYVAYVDEPFMS